MITLIIKGSKGGINEIDSIKQALSGNFIRDEVELFTCSSSKALFIALCVNKKSSLPQVLQLIPSSASVPPSVYHV